MSNNERTPAPGVEEWEKTIDGWKMFPEKEYSGLIDYDRIDIHDIKSFIRTLLTTHQQEKEALQEYYEKQMTDAYHSGFVAGQGEKEALVREILSKQSKPWNYRLDEPGTVAMVEVKDIRAIAKRHGITSDTLKS